MAWFIGHRCKDFVKSKKRYGYIPDLTCGWRGAESMGNPEFGLELVILESR
jgi:hypothetical protein